MHDLTLTSRQAAILATGVRGGDGEEPPAEPTPTDPPAAEATPAEGTAPEETAPTAETAEGETPTAEEPTAPVLAEAPEVPDVLDALTDVQVREMYEATRAAYAARRPLARTEADVVALQEIRRNELRLHAAIDGRMARQQDAIDGPLADLDAQEVPTLPDPTPAFASASAGDLVPPPTVAVTEPAAITEEPTRTASAARSRPRVTMQAAAGSGLAQQGTDIDFATLGHMIERVVEGGEGSTYLAALAGFDQMGEQDFTGDILAGSNVERNHEIIRQAQAEHPYIRGWRGYESDDRPSHTAAICDPLEPIRDIPIAFQTTEVVAPSLPGRPVGRGGFQFIPSIKLSQVSAGSTIWTETSQANVVVGTSSTWKPIVDVTCQTVSNVRIKWATAALRFDNTTEMSNPEVVQNFLAALMAAKARNKEAQILADLDALSGAYTFTGSYGALPTFAKAVNGLIAQMAYADRIVEPSYTVYIPRAVSTLLGVDRVSKAFGQDLQPVDVVNELRATLDGVAEVIETADAPSTEPGYPLFRLQEPGDPEIAVPELYGEYRVRIIDTSGALFGETGETNTGVQRSPDLMRMNKAQLFAEEGFLTAKTGPQHWAYIDMQLCDSGSRGGTVTPYTCTTAS
jgi:hypothetical protein